ncbi:MAG: hypothetical protein Ta2F_17600 [Termitinemataceae bacterium]|nr:MAG: hypothetical protein Ta2F_17600 [Termitinemataceae bacterium]
MECKECKTEIPVGLKYCPHCGEKVIPKRKIKCKKCEEILESRWKFCPMCGTDAKPKKTAAKKKVDKKSLTKK